jgi:hypothetical protein
MRIYEGERFAVVARCLPDGKVTVSVGRAEYSDEQVWNHSHSFLDRVGYVNPKQTGILWWRRWQPSVADAVQAAMQDLHRREFQLEEGERQIAAARHSLKAIADLERELAQQRAE